MLIGMLVKVLVVGVVMFVGLDLYFIGGILLFDYGYGVSLNFLYLLCIDVKVGDWVE